MGREIVEEVGAGVSDGGFTSGDSPLAAFCAAWAVMAAALHCASAVAIATRWEEVTGWGNIIRVGK